MKFVNTVELKNQTNRILKSVRHKHAVLVTHRGHPCAAIIPVAEEDIEDLIWEFSPKMQKRLELAEREMKAGKKISFKEFARRYGFGA